MPLTHVVCFPLSRCSSSCAVITAPYYYGDRYPSSQTLQVPGPAWGVPHPSSFLYYYGDLFVDNAAGVGDVLTITAGPPGFNDFSGVPWIMNDPVRQTLSGQVTYNCTGVVPIILTATNLANQTSLVKFTITVLPTINGTHFNATTNETVVETGSPPVANHSAISLTVRQDVFFSVLLPYQLFKDPAGRPMDLILRRKGSFGLPSFVNFSNSIVSGLPRFVDIGTWLLSIEAYNTLGLSTALDYTIIVKTANS